MLTPRNIPAVGRNNNILPNITLTPCNILVVGVDNNILYNMIHKPFNIPAIDSNKLLSISYKMNESLVVSCESDATDNL